ncbi:MAG: hypothetical protein O6934_02650 [SAR324 cluster bacterium]|nr:hypothetical protein [SAR324 cluster bacterium]
MQENGLIPIAIGGISPQLLRKQQFSRQKTADLDVVARPCLEGPLRDLSLDSVSVEEQERLMEPFRLYRGLATYYLWRAKSGRQPDWPGIFSH